MQHWSTYSCVYRQCDTDCGAIANQAQPCIPRLLTHNSRGYDILANVNSALGNSQAAYFDIDSRSERWENVVFAREVVVQDNCLRPMASCTLDFQPGCAVASHNKCNLSGHIDTLIIGIGTHGTRCGGEVARHNAREVALPIDSQLRIVITVWIYSRAVDSNVLRVFPINGNAIDVVYRLCEALKTDFELVLEALRTTDDKVDRGCVSRLSGRPIAAICICLEPH